LINSLYFTMSPRALCASCNAADATDNECCSCDNKNHGLCDDCFRSDYDAAVKRTCFLWRALTAMGSYSTAGRSINETHPRCLDDVVSHAKDVCVYLV
jgi:hypothetical protein